MIIQNKSLRLCRRAKRSDCKAFTLVELLTVMLIITVLMGLIIGIAPYAKRAQQVAKTRAEIEMIHTALQEHKMDMGYYPPALTGSEVTNWMSSAFDFTDSWGTAYDYTKTGDHSYELYSWGKDKASGTPDEKNDDIYSGK